MSLTKQQRHTLECMEEARTDHPEWIGMHPNRGQHAHFNRLQKLGLIRYSGMGVSETDEDEQERVCYVVTEVGLAELKRARRER